MATIIHRRGRYYVVYNYKRQDGSVKQKWETYKTRAEADDRKKEVEYKQSIGTFKVKECKTLNDLLSEYITLYGKENWAPSTYSGNISLIKHYISPIIGNMKLTDINTHVIERYYQKLLSTKRVSPTIGKKDKEYCSPKRVKEVHKVLRGCFTQAVKWDIMEKNPCQYATVPKSEYKKREIWDAETLFHALDVCDDERLSLCINLAFACSLRMGELLGLTWDCVDISEESIEKGCASIYVNKELQRVGRDALKTLDNKDVIFMFPASNSLSATVLVLKTPKTKTSTRKIFLPKTVAEMLIKWKEKQDAAKEMLGDEYQDFNLVITGPLGMPTEGSTISSDFQKLIEKNDLPRVVFHSLRHTSITYKLKLNGGDIKSVQGDSGHAQVSMVTDVYSHILDEDRKYNAQKFEEEFYSGKAAAKKKTPEPEKKPEEDASVEQVQDNAALLLKLLSDPKTTELLKTLMNAN